MRSKFVGDMISHIFSLVRPVDWLLTPYFRELCLIEYLAVGKTSLLLRFVVRTIFHDLCGVWDLFTPLFQPESKHVLTTIFDLVLGDYRKDPSLAIP